MYSFWVALTNLQQFVNSIIWHNNNNIVAPVWCDISIRLQLVAPIGIRACTLVLCIQLFNFTRFKDANIVESRRSVILSMGLMLGLPLLILALYIIIQPFRFEILEEIGCVPTMYSFVSYILFNGPELFFSAIAAALIPFTFPIFNRMSVANKENLQAVNHSTGTTGSYKRQMVIVCLDTAFNLPVLIVALIQDITSGKANDENLPYKSWSNVHHGAGGTYSPEQGLGTILEESATSWSTNKWSTLSVKWDEWIFVAYAIVFFAVFGTTREMKKLASDCVRVALRRLRLRRGGMVEQHPGKHEDLSPKFAPAPARNTRVAPRRDSESLWSDESSDIADGNHNIPLAGAIEFGDGFVRPDTFELRSHSPESIGLHTLVFVSNGEDEITIMTENSIILSV